MSDEEDYMSDAFLAKIEKQDVRPSLIRSHAQKHEIAVQAKKRKIEQETKVKNKPQTNLEHGLQKAIGADNKGFAMLAKMGFKPGTSLGKNNDSAIKEPIKISLKSDRTGLGRDSQIKEQRQQQADLRKKEILRKLNAPEMSVDQYREQMKQQSEEKQVEWDLRKCQRTCRQLDLENRLRYPVRDWFWPPEKPKDPEEEPEEEEEKDEISPADKLNMLRKFLRNSYFYCDFCSEKYKDAEELMSSCPGPNKDDH